MFLSNPAAPTTPTAAPAAPAAPTQAMQPLGGPGTPASPQALPYSYFPAPRIGPASAGQPAAPVAPMIQNTQTQINDALMAARGVQPPAQASEHSLGRQQPGYGALGMAAQRPQQQPQPWASFMQPQPSNLANWFQQMSPQGAGPGGQDFMANFPPQLREMLGNIGQQPRFWGGFNWNGSRGAPEPGRSPDINIGPRQGFGDMMPGYARQMMSDAFSGYRGGGQ